MDDIQELYYLFPEIKDEIIVEKKVGQGTFSFVYVGHFRADESRKVALKYVIPTSSPSRTKQEIECLMNIGGRDNVIGVSAVLRNKSHILILMPYINNVSFYESFIHWSVDEVRDYIKNLVIALKRVHECGTIHRDIKPSNFLYDREKKIYALVDFGLAQKYDKDSSEFVLFEYETKAAGAHKTGGGGGGGHRNENRPSITTTNSTTPSSCASSRPQSHLIAINRGNKDGNSSSISSASKINPNLVLTNSNQTNMADSRPINTSDSLAATTTDQHLTSATSTCKAADECKDSAASDLLAETKRSSTCLSEARPAQIRNSVSMNISTCQQQQQQQQLTPSHASKANEQMAMTPGKNNTGANRLATGTPQSHHQQPANATGGGGVGVNSPSLTAKLNTSVNFQKYRSFHKTSFVSNSDQKCTCFNMQFVCDVCTSRPSKWAPRAGTAGFRAPEVLFRSTYQTPSVDIWSVGVIFLSLLSGRYPFFKSIDDNMAIMQLISLFGVEMVQRAAQKYGESLICSYQKRPMDLASTCKMLRKSAVDGLNASEDVRQTLVREFPDSAYDLLKKMLEIDGNKRISCENILKHAFMTSSSPTNATSTTTAQQVQEMLTATTEAAI